MYNPNLAQSWMLFFTTILCILAAGGVIRIIIHVAGITTNEWVSLSSSALGFAAVALIVIRLGGGNDEAPVATTRLSPFIWLLLVPFIWSVSLAVTPLTMWIPMPDIIKQLFSFQNNLPTFLSMVVLAPVCEEWLCRGVILKGLLAHYPPRKAIIWSAVIFGVLHLNPWQGISAFFGGLAIGWIYWRTRSLGYCIFMHAAKNAMGFILIFFFPNISFDSTSIEPATGFHIYAAALFVCAITLAGINKIISSGTTSDIRIR